jgi:hypothetical protein
MHASPSQAQDDPSEKGGFIDTTRHRVLVQFEIPQGLSFRSAAVAREESAVSLLAASRFLVDKAGFGMTMRVFLAQTAPPSGTGVTKI